MHFALDIGIRYLRARKKKTVAVIQWIAVAGVALGVGSLLSVLAITTGFEEEFRNKVLGVNAHVLVMKYGLDFEEYRDVIARAEEMPEVAAAAPFLIREMIIAKDGRSAGVLIKGIDPTSSYRVLDLPSQIVEGRLDGLRHAGAAPPTNRAGGVAEGELDRYLHTLVDRVEGVVPAPATAPTPAETSVQESPVELDVSVPSPEAAEQALRETETTADGDIEDLMNESSAESSATAIESLPGIVLGRELARSLDAHVGERITVTSPLAGIDTSFLGHNANQEVARSVEFLVIGFFHAGFQEYDNHLAYVDLYEAQRLDGHGDSVTGVEMTLTDLTHSGEVAEYLGQSLGGGPYHTLDWQELNRNLFTALQIQKVMLSLVITTIMFVAAFNVVATLIMVVIERRREVAMLKAMGARKRHIASMFMMQGFVIGALGTALGLLLGGGVCTYLEYARWPLDPGTYLIDHLPVVNRPIVYGYATFIALSIAVIATILPSLWAGAQVPAHGVKRD